MRYAAYILPMTSAPKSTVSNICKSHCFIISCIAICQRFYFACGYKRGCTPPIPLDPPSSLACWLQSDSLHWALRQNINSAVFLLTSTTTFLTGAHTSEECVQQFTEVWLEVFGLFFSKVNLNLAWDNMALRQHSDKEPRIELFVKVSNFFIHKLLAGRINTITPKYMNESNNIYNSTWYSY